MIKPNPSTPTAEATAMSAEWAMIDALLGGTNAMRESGEAYLPKHPAEATDAYNYRKKVSTLFNGFRRTVETLASKPFSEPLKLVDDVPPKIVDYCEDIDLEGRNLQAFAHEVFKTAMAKGLSHILVDYPRTLEGLTLADQRKSGVRPYFVHIKPDSVIGWVSQRVQGVETLLQLRLLEEVAEPDGEWATKIVKQVRVLEPDNFRIYRKNDQEEWFLHDSGSVSIGFIPLATVYCDRTGFMMARPPLLDLAFLNVEHWQSASDQSNILHVARVPILFASGFSDEKPIKIGAGVAVTNDDPSSSLTYVEHSGAAIEAGRQSLKDLEDRMSLMGAQLLVRQQIAVTATEDRRDSAEADSQLSMMALSLQNTIEKALGFAAKWDGLETGGSIEVCTDYCADLDALSTQDLMRAKELGVLSAETVFAELQRRGIVNEDAKWKEEAARLKKEGPPVGIQGSFETTA